MKKNNMKEDTPTSFPDDDNNSACFSSDAENEFQKHKASSSSSTTSKPSTQQQQQQSSSSSQPKPSKWRDLRERGMWSLIMILLFALILCLGHFYCAILVLCVILCIFNELIAIPPYKERTTFIPNTSTITWRYFFTGMYFMLIHMLKSKISFLTNYKPFYYLLTYHNFISFTLYIFSFLSFITYLKKGYYKYQFGQFAYIHIILIIFGTSASLIVNNIFNGIIWFLLPASLVIVNDITAYIWGRMLGKHMLTPLSPKKTIEGFVGAFISTLIWGYFITEWLVKYDAMICPSERVDVVPFKILNYHCDDVYGLRRNVTLNVFGVVVNVKAIQVHTFFFGLFAGLVAPFGGLFASGFKRAIKIKDFADTIPGHGGLTDRMDCQILMGMFTYVWLNQFAFKDRSKDVNEFLNVVEHMTRNDKMFLLGYLKDSLGL